MANYLFVLSSKKKSSVVESFVDGADCFKKYNKNCNVFIKSKDADKLTSRGKLSYLKGVCINHTRKEILFSTYANEIYEKNNFYEDDCEGSFFSAQELLDSVFLIKNDFFNQLPLFYYFSEDIFIASDSLLVIKKFLNYIGLRTKLNKNEFFSRGWVNAISQQPVSYESIIKDVYMLQVGSSLIVDGSDDYLKVTTKVKDLQSFFFNGQNDSYYSLFGKAYEEIAGVFGALNRIDDSIFSFDLSGGMDSRACFSFALKTLDPNKVFVSSSEKNFEDFAVSKEIADFTGFKINVETHPIKRVPKNNLYALFNLGVYDSFYSPQYVHDTDFPRFKIGGHGAETFKGNYSWKSLFSIKRHMKTDSLISKAFYIQAMKSLSASNVSRSCLFNSEAHYLLQRNSVHSNRTILSGFYGVKPLINKNLIKAGYFISSSQCSSDYPHNNILHDIIIANSPSLANMKYDNENKNISRDCINYRLNKINENCSLSISAYESFGDSKNIGYSVLDFFIDLSEEALGNIYTSTNSSSEVSDLIKNNAFLDDVFGSMSQVLTSKESTRSAKESVISKVNSFLVLIDDI